MVHDLVWVMERHSLQRPSEHLGYARMQAELAGLLGAVARIATSARSLVAAEAT